MTSKINYLLLEADDLRYYAVSEALTWQLAVRTVCVQRSLRKEALRMSEDPLN